MTALPLPLSAREHRQPYLRLAVPERSRSSPDGDLSPSNFSNTEKVVNERSRDAPPLQCLECQGWDSSMPENSVWGFCILRGQYLKREEATGCDRFMAPKGETAPPRKRRRGDGSGYIQLHYHKSKKGKSYDQY